MSTANSPDSNSEAVLSAFITNLGKYNEGTIVGEWLDFPTTAEKLAQTMKNIGIDGVKHEEYFISDYNTVIGGLSEMLGEYANLDELNYFASKIDKLQSSSVIKTLEAVITEEEYIDFPYLINLLEEGNLNCYEFIPYIKDDKDLGSYYILVAGTYDIIGTESLVNYIDFERFGRDMHMKMGGTYVNGGYFITYNRDIIRNYYDNPDDIPYEHRLLEKLIGVSVEQPSITPDENTKPSDSVKDFQQLVASARSGDVVTLGDLIKSCGIDHSQFSFSESTSDESVHADRLREADMSEVTTRRRPQ